MCNHETPNRQFPSDLEVTSAARATCSLQTLERRARRARLLVGCAPLGRRALRSLRRPRARELPTRGGTRRGLERRRLRGRLPRPRRERHRRQQQRRRIGGVVVVERVSRPWARPMTQARRRSRWSSEDSLRLYARMDHRHQALQRDRLQHANVTK